MKKFGSLAIALFGFSSVFYAQQNWCGTDAKFNETISNNPELLQPFIEHNTRISGGMMTAGDRSDPIVIPVVVHVLHDNGIGNISYDQIVSGIEQLNIDYNRQNADTIDTRNTTGAPFEAVAVSFDISFALAKIDPDGNCTNGVERKNAPAVTYNANEDAKYDATGGLDAWPRDQYMNIWIVNSIENDGSGGVTLGYAQFPQFADDGYGILIRHDSYGTIGTASGDRTLTHEMGHCLGLLHTFQGPFIGPGTGCHTTDCGGAGDFCCDTPPSSAAHWDCPPSYNSCTGVPVNDPYGFDAYDQWENYMSYAPCQNMFSQGQYDIVSANLSNIGFLVDLVSLTNQTATGVLAPEVLCAAEFYSDKQIICAGQSVDFFDDSYFNVTGWSWTFPGGTAGSLTVQNPTVTYATAGTYDVTLEVTDGISTVTKTLTDYILVLPAPGDEVPYKEGFENLTSVPDNDRFFVQNANAGTTWELNTGVAYTGNDCAYLNNFGNDDGSTDALISGTIDLSGVDAADEIVFYFRYAYKKRVSATDEWLKIYVSKDCGESWSLRKNIHGSALSSSMSSSAYTPASPDEWVEVSITNITADYYVEDFRYKIEFTNDNGNNIYIDHINLFPESMTGTVEMTDFTAAAVYPNPTEGNTTLSFVSPAQNNCRIEVYDAVGNLVTYVYEGYLAAGTQSFEINTDILASGIYMIRIVGDNETQTLKLIKE